MAYRTDEASAEPKQNSVANAIGDFDPVLSRAEKVAHTLQQLCDRLRGPRPQEVNKAQGDASAPSALIASIHERRSRLVKIIDEMENCAQTLDASL